jgi:hypothetical protein
MPARYRLEAPPAVAPWPAVPTAGRQVLYLHGRNPVSVAWARGVCQPPWAAALTLPLLPAPPPALPALPPR